MPDDPAAAGAHRCSDRDLFLARSAAREKKVGDVRAGNQQHQSNRAEEREERRLYFADHSFVKNLETGVPAFVRVGKFLRVLGVDRADARLRLLEIDPGVETRDRLP